MQFDCLVRGGTIVDGSGHRVPSPGDVGIVGDRIAAVGDLEGAQAARVIDAHDRVISPGFIDVHVHSEIALLGGQDQMASVRQGITTNLTSPDGFGWAPLNARDARAMWRYTQFAYGEADLSLDWPSVEDYLDLFGGRIPANVYPQVPHGTVRLRAMGWAPRPAVDEEVQVMIHTTREWMDAGAGALSLGLDYQPGANARLRELTTLARTVAPYGGVYAAHIRSQLLGTVGGWQETLEIARQTGVPVHISHARVDANVGQILDQVERDGIDLTFESYLYPAGMTHLALFLPVDVQAGSLDDMLDRMADPYVRQRCLSHLRGKLGQVGDQIVGYTCSGRYVGLTLAEAAQSVRKPWAEFVYDLVLDEGGMETFTVPWPITGPEREEILRRTARHPRMMVASDGVYGIPHPHPRGYGCFVRVLRRFVRELGLLSLEQAIYKMSGFPAQRFGLNDRGQITSGRAADLVVFDPLTVADRSTWEEPRRTPLGVEWVMVNGELAVERGAPTGKLPGRVLRRSA